MGELAVGVRIVISAGQIDARHADTGFCKSLYVRHHSAGLTVAPAFAVRSLDETIRAERTGDVCHHVTATTPVNLGTETAVYEESDVCGA